VLLLNSGKESWDIDKGNEGDVEGIAESDPPGSFDRGSNIQDPRGRVGLLMRSRKTPIEKKKKKIRTRSEVTSQKEKEKEKEKENKKENKKEKKEKEKKNLTWLAMMETVLPSILAKPMTMLVANSGITSKKSSLSTTFLITSLMS